MPHLTAARQVDNARQRRLSKDYERKVQTSEMLLQLAMIRLMVRRLARSIG
jgi:putative transposase